MVVVSAKNIATNGRTAVAANSVEMSTFTYLLSSAWGVRSILHAFNNLNELLIFRPHSLQWLSKSRSEIMHSVHSQEQYGREETGARTNAYSVQAKGWRALSRRCIAQN